MAGVRMMNSGRSQSIVSEVRVVRLNLYGIGSGPCGNLDQPARPFGIGQMIIGNLRYDKKAAGSDRFVGR